MAEIRLRLREADGRLPMVCMCCGEPATVTKTKKMSWCPPWVGVLIVAGLLPYAIVASILTKRARVQGPLCEQHKGHWLYRLLILWLTLAVVGFVGLVAIIAVASLPRHLSDSLGPFICIGSVGLFVVWLIGIIIMQYTAIRPKEITDRDILLTGVCDSFVEAVEDADRAGDVARRKRRARLEDDYDYDDDEPKPKKARRSDAIHDEDRPRKRPPPPPDAIEE